jgi:TonB family protein
VSNFVAVVVMARKGLGFDMLQPLQLQDVSVSYANEIAELRNFLAKAGMPLDSALTLGGIAARLREDRAFRRDLISHVWVVLHLTGRQISYSDLLGILAVAAAGTRFAAAADETDAHDLLRFLMEARSSFDAGAVVKAVEPVRPIAVVAPAEVATLPKIAAPTEPVRAVRYVPEPLVSDEEEESGRSPVVWMAAAACLVAAMLLGLWMHYKPSDPATTAAVIAPSVSAEKDSAQPVERSESSTVKAAPAPTLHHSPHTITPKPMAGTPREAVQPMSPTQRKPAPIVRSTAPVAAARPSVPVMHPFVVPTVPPARLSASEEAVEDAPQPFKLLRRPGAANSKTAESRPLDTLANSRAGTTSAVRGGTVHPTSLGAMAANVMYSPAPAYPQEATAAHVQGEVKLEAEVDSDGNVTSARVISGPPLLREAATGALEHWRYKPYMYEGKPISMSALVVMDFKLP